MSKLTEEQEWQDRIEQQEHEDCNQVHSSTGMCPCCGVEVIEHAHTRWIQGDDDEFIEESQQVCPSCGWESWYLYDA